MLALSPASGAHWANLLTPLESALTDCCLSYKQNAPVSPLNSALTNASHLPESTHFETACFHTLSRTSPATPLDSALTKNTRDGGTLRPLCARRLPRSGRGAPACPDPVGVAKSLFSGICSLFVLSLRSFAHPFPLFSATSSLFSENTRGGGAY